MDTRIDIALLVCTLGLAAGAAQAQETGKLKFSAHRDFKFVLPEDVWTPAADGVGVKHPAGGSFRTVKDGVKMAVDTTGDGKTDDVVKGSKGYLLFQSKSGGESFRYAARFQGGNGVYKYASSCSLFGKIGSVPIRLFDLNNNGSFDEVGTDAMIVGSGKAASYVSKVVSYKGKLYELKIAPGAETATVQPFAGEAGKIEVKSGFHSKGKLTAAIVSDGNGNSFEVADAGGVIVPAGEYRVVAGLVSKGSQTARVRAGKMKPIHVAADATANLTWGGPLVAEFTHVLASGNVTVEPRDLKYYGAAGEEYFDWAPNAKSPKFAVHDPDTGREVGSFIFAGC